MDDKKEKPLRKGEEPLHFLRKSVYPELYAALLKLIDHIIKTDEIRKHQERLKKKKVFDKLEQRRVEKDRLKAELGSEYESSEDEESIDYEELGIDKEELEQILAEGMQKKVSGEDGQAANGQAGEDDRAKRAQRPNLDKIAEEEGAQDEEEDSRDGRSKRKKQLQQQRDDDGFNPLKFLATELKNARKAQIKK